MTPADLTALRDRITSASGPDRELDRDIGLLLWGWKRVEVAGRMMIEDHEGNLDLDHPGSLYPSPTESIDAAVALIEQQGWSWKVMRHENGRYYAEAGPEPWQFAAPTAPLTLLLALIDALLAQEAAR